ncbi:MAG: helix-turn-helix transcriptional regulator [Clostridiales bacterium]|nr:helix-turn-helix transcriptional regulator [Clostridiales bacterium]
MERGITMTPYFQAGFAVMYARKSLGLTQQDLALRSGIAQADICKIESGHYNTSLKTLTRLAEAMGKIVRVSFVDPV